MGDVICPLHRLTDAQSNIPQADECLDDDEGPRWNEKRRVEDSNQDYRSIQPWHHTRLSSEKRLELELVSVLVKETDDGEDGQ